MEGGSFTGPIILELMEQLGTFTSNYLQNERNNMPILLTGLELDIILYHYLEPFYYVREEAEILGTKLPRCQKVLD